MEITVNFISQTDVSKRLPTVDVFANHYMRFWLLVLNLLFFQLELKEVTALCDIQGMISPLVLHLVASKPKKLSVKYSLPNTR